MPLSLVHTRPVDSPGVLALSLSKADIEVLGKGLGDLGVTVVSTGGTAKKLRETGLEVKDVSEVTNFPEMLGACARACAWTALSSS